jgi:hypothetical protein
MDTDTASAFSRVHPLSMSYRHADGREDGLHPVVAHALH